MPEDQPILKTSLLDLLHELRGHGTPLILAGGYGLYLKQVHLQETLSGPSLIPGDLWPAPRATEDLDVLLRTEVLVDTDCMRSIREALDQLGYTAIPEAKYMQFVKTLGGGRFVKIDLLTGPLGAFAGDSRLRVDDRRVRPRQSVQLHAHRTDEAVAFEENTLAIPVNGLLSNGEHYAAVVHVPQALTLIVMKLHAFRDCCRDTEKDMARHHALDLYRIVAMMTEQEFEQTQHEAQAHRADAAVTEARRIATDSFSSPEALGSLRLREHPLWNEAMDLAGFLSALKDLMAAVG